MGLNCLMNFFFPHPYVFKDNNGIFTVVSILSSWVISVTRFQGIHQLNSYNFWGLMHPKTQLHQSQFMC